MSLTSPPPKPRREYKIGEVVEPAEKPKLVVKPSRFADSGTSPRGVFQNGRSSR